MEEGPCDPNLISPSDSASLTMVRGKQAAITLQGWWAGLSQLEAQARGVSYFCVPICWTLTVSLWTCITWKRNSGLLELVGMDVTSRPPALYSAGMYQDLKEMESFLPFHLHREWNEQRKSKIS